MALVFVYGTFLRGCANNGVLLRLGASFFADARTAEPRTLVELGPYPAIVDAHAPDAPPPPGPVLGEVWDVPEASLDALDEFEGCPDLYRRERIDVEMEAGARHAAFVYVFARRLPRRARVIASGRYEAKGDALPEGATPAQLEEEP